MEQRKIYEDIALRTEGDIYIGVVGPVRTGKSTFIKRFMETMVIPNIDNVYRRERARVSGHSKFANIKHKKEKNDAKKGKIFTVIGRELVMAVKAGGPDPNNNSKLRDVIAKAKANNMPNDTIERGIKKAAGADSADSYEKAVYEGYGPNGVAIIVETDRKSVV